LWVLDKVYSHRITKSASATAQGLQGVGSAGCPVLKAAGDQDYSVIRQFAARSGLGIGAESGHR
jgi:hypothetical protein